MLRNRTGNTEFSKSNWHVNKLLHNIDNFAYKIPSFNLKGKEKITTIAGGMLSALIFSITLAYAIQSLHAIVEGTDPIINEKL